VAAHPRRARRADGAGHGQASRALLVGWLWGWGHFAVGTNWIATAFTYQAQMPAWLGWIAVLMLAVYLALFPALAGLMGWWLARRWALAPIPALAACWILAEWVRGWLFTGFPWNPLAAATLGGFDRPGLARLLPWTGTYALSGLVVVLAGLWLLAVGAARQGRRGRGLALALVPMALFLARSAAIPAQGRSPSPRPAQYRPGRNQRSHPLRSAVHPRGHAVPAAPPARAAMCSGPKAACPIFCAKAMNRAGMPPAPMAATRCWRARAWAG
jgi:apolipoprotein N-acyltransferase